MHFFTSSALGLLATLVSLSTAQGIDSFIEIRQEYCDRGNLCLTSFDWCQSGTEYSTNNNISVGYCDRRGLDSSSDGSFRYVPGSSSLSGVVVFLYAMYNLTWSGADPNYPVQVDFTFGPPQGPINRTAPLWSKNVTESSLQFMFSDIFLELSDRDVSTNISYTGYGLGWTSFFTISQPERPDTPGINATDTSNAFQISSIDLRRLDRQYEQESAVRQADSNRMWRLGVGIGVGLGVPILITAAYLLGRSSGKKLATRKVSKDDFADKGNSDRSDESHASTM